MHSVVLAMNKKISIVLLFIKVPEMTSGIEEPGIGYISAYLKKQINCDVTILYQEAGAIDLPKLIRLRPDMVGMPMYTISKKAVLQAAKKIKLALPETKICLGGYGVTGENKVLCSNPMIDFVILGEGEIPFSQLVEHLHDSGFYSEIHGLTYKIDDRVCSNPIREETLPLDTLPHMDRQILLSKGYKTALISTARGCSGHCTFCSTQSIYHSWRGESVTRAVDEIESIQRHYGIFKYYFIDCSFDNPDFAYQRMMAIAEEIVHRNLDIRYSAFFRSEFHLAADDKLMEKLKASGLYCAIVGVEAANDEDLHLYGKQAKRRDSTATIDLFRRFDICAEIGFIMFHPYSSLCSLRQNAKFLKKYSFMCFVDYWLSEYTPHFGTPLEKKVRRDGLLYDADGIAKIKYQNTCVARLYQYMMDYLYQIKLSTKVDLTAFHAIIVNTDYILSMFSNISEIRDIVTETAPVSIDMREELNVRLFNWFYELIDLAEKQWNSIDADRISEKYLSRDYVRQFNQQYLSRQPIYFLKLARASVRYSQLNQV